VETRKEDEIWGRRRGSGRGEGKVLKDKIRILTTRGLNPLNACDYERGKKSFGRMGIQGKEQNVGKKKPTTSLKKRRNALLKHHGCAITSALGAHDEGKKRGQLREKGGNGNERGEPGRKKIDRRNSKRDLSSQAPFASRRLRALETARDWCCLPEDQAGGRGKTGAD